MAPADGAATGSPGQGKPLHVLGDSFAGAPPFQAALQKALPDYAITFDAVGGSTLAEQASRFAATPTHWSVPLIVLDGGLTDPAPLSVIDGIVARLNGRCREWIYVEPVQRSSVGNQKGSRRYESQRVRVEEIAERYPDAMLRIIPALQAHDPQSADTRQAVEQGWVPRSLSRDGLHLNEKGYAILADQIALRMREIERRCARAAQG